jgi:AcrR family transcriptional regulator
MSASATKQRILDVAEVQFANHGYAGASLRGIIAAAQVNLAAVHYHFRSKESLLEAVLLRRGGPLNQQRLRLLDGLEAKTGGAAAPLEGIIEAFIGPPIHLVFTDGGEAKIFGKLVGRLYAESGEHFFQMIKKHFATVAMRFAAALQKACPELSEEELRWRFHCMAGVMAHTLLHGNLVEVFAEKKSKHPDVRVVMDRLVRFLAAGFRAPAGTSRAKAKKRMRKP